MASVFRRLPSEVATRIAMLATSSPYARCFYADAEDEWTSCVLQAFKGGRIFHADEWKTRMLQQKRDNKLEDLFFQREYLR